MTPASPRRVLALVAAFVLLGLLVPALAAAAAMRPRVAIVGTGGTISGVGPDRSNPIDYRSGQLLIADMVSALQPEVGLVADVSTVQFGNRGSGSYALEEFRGLTKSVEQQLRTNDAAVVTTGTDTMEEFAYWLDLTVRSKKPVVVTGSMRPWTSLSSDAQLNLFNAIRLAASGRTRCMGSVVMLNDEIHAARDVTKTNTTRLDTFSSRRKGQLGYIDGPKIRVDRSVPRRELCNDQARWRTPFDVDKLNPMAPLPRVEIVTAYQSAGGEAITAYANAGVRGMVTAGTGAGGISPAMSQARTAAVGRGVTFISASRTGSGSVDGSSSGIIAGGDLLPQKARILLALSLAFSAKPDTVADWIVRYGNPEFTTPAD